MSIDRLTLLDDLYHIIVLETCPEAEVRSLLASREEALSLVLQIIAYEDALCRK